MDGLLAMDAVSVILRSLSAMLDSEPEVFKNTFRRGQVYNNETRGIHCRSEPLLPWVHGRAIIQSLRDVSKSRSLCIPFDLYRAISGSLLLRPVTFKDLDGRFLK